MIVADTREVDNEIRRLMAAVDAQSVTAALMAGGKVVERKAKLKIREYKQTEDKMIDTGNLRNSITAEPEGVKAVVIGPGDVEYAAIHEFGGTTHPQVTATMRRWAWAMFRETGEEMYRRIALTNAATLTVRIPARPYMRPALDENEAEVMAAISDALRRRIG